ITNTSPADTDPVTVTSVVDDKLGDLTAAANAAWVAQGHSVPIVLAQGQTFRFSFTTAAAVNAGTVVDTGTVRGHDAEHSPATAPATVPVPKLTPTLAVEQTGPPPLAHAPPATHCRSITNPSPAGTDPVTVTSVVDDRLGDLTSAANAAWVAQGHSGPIVLAP